MASSADSSANDDLETVSSSVEEEPDQRHEQSDCGKRDEEQDESDAGEGDEELDETDEVEDETDGREDEADGREDEAHGREDETNGREEQQDNEVEESDDGQEAVARAKSTSAVEAARSAAKAALTKKSLSSLIKEAYGKATAPGRGPTEPALSSKKNGLKMPAMKTSKSLTTKDMIVHAINDLNDRRGSTIPAIKKYMTSSFVVSESRLRMVSKLLKQSNEEGWLVQVSGHGASSDSHFKLSEEMKKNVKTVEKKSEAKEKIEKEKKVDKNEKQVTNNKRKAAVQATSKKEVPVKKKVTEVTIKKAAAATAIRKRKA